ncbi:MAG: hypothetical protein AAF919_01485 [Pseudomonadota bacterium]
MSDVSWHTWLYLLITYVPLELFLVILAPIGWLAVWALAFGGGTAYAIWDAVGSFRAYLRGEPRTRPISVAQSVQRELISPREAAERTYIDRF